TGSLAEMIREADREDQIAAARAIPRNASIQLPDAPLQVAKPVNTDAGNTAAVNTAPAAPAATTATTTVTPAATAENKTVTAENKAAPTTDNKPVATAENKTVAAENKAAD